MKRDFLIIGAGIAGLSYSIKVALKWPDANILVISKEGLENSNTQYAQGGIAGVLPCSNDAINRHVEDTLIAGDHQNDQKTVNMVVTEASESIDDLINWGVDFDKNITGKYDFGLEGGHSKHRVLHHKDFTGKEIQEKLLKQARDLKNIELCNHHFALELITNKDKEDPRVIGAYIFDSKNEKVETVVSKIVFLATGGIGQVYKTTTNPNVATGDGIALAYRIGANIEGMELVQFHPTALFAESGDRAFLISEAVRGAGAILRNEFGEAYMEKYDDRKDLAPRDIVARANLNEIQSSTIPFVYLDVTHLQDGKFEDHFPVISAKCKELGLDLKTDFIPVAPAAHYLCGGISVNRRGKTSHKGMYACGECSSTGLHGTNRLASNSLLEAVVYANQSYKSVLKVYDSIDFEENVDDFWHPVVKKNLSLDLPLAELRKKLQWLMSSYMAVEKTNESLIIADKEVELISKKFEQLIKEKSYTIKSLEFRNLLSIAQLIIEHSLIRVKNSGVFFNKDL
ncbi:MAG: L-aspartate oxidase [Flavobacteriales bacterium]|nr:L-aspartate oxidase [Flavobacteriales bacterium]